MNRRVVITGLGLCTPVGRDVATCWQNLLSGRSGIGPITLFDASALPVRIGGEVRGGDPARWVEAFPAAAGERDRKIWLGLEAAAQAIADCGLPPAALARAMVLVGVSLEAFRLEDLCGTGGRLGGTASWAARWLQRSPRSPLQTPLDRLAQILGHTLGTVGRRITNCSACAAGAQVLGEALRHLRRGTADLALAGAADSVLNPLGLGGFSLLQILSTENDRPTSACRPFDATRQGTVLAEGAAFLILETLDHARRRGARIYAEILGYGSSLDAYRVTDPEPTGRGAASSMLRAIRDAGLTPDEIDGVNAHGTGTPKNDVAETRALRQTLGARAQAVPVTANKSMTGHMIATSGAAEAAICALSLFNRALPPTLNLVERDPDCDLDYVAEGWRPFAGRTLLSNSFGFGGQNATLIFGRPEP